VPRPGTSFRLGLRRRIRAAEAVELPSTSTIITLTPSAHSVSRSDRLARGANNATARFHCGTLGRISLVEARHAAHAKAVWSRAPP